MIVFREGRACARGAESVCERGCELGAGSVASMCLEREATQIVLDLNRRGGEGKIQSSSRRVNRLGRSEGKITRSQGKTLLQQTAIDTHHFEMKVRLPSLCLKCHSGAKACVETERSMHWPAAASRDAPGICKTP